MAISIRENLKLSIFDFFSRKIRNLITILSIVLGTMSIIVILAIVNGVKEASLSWMMETGGVKKINVYQIWNAENKLNLPTYFTLKELDFIRENIPKVEAFNATIYQWSQLSYGSNATGAQVMGTYEDFTIVDQWDADKGRFFNHIDITNSSDVIVIGSTVANELFGTRNPIGEYITVGKKRLMVIGVMKFRSMKGQGMGMYMDNNPLEYLNKRTFVPISTMINKLRSDDRIDNISIRAINENDIYKVTSELENIILNLRRGQKLFRVESGLDDVNQANKVTQMISIIFFFISSVSLIVGGIVVMNIMLATIKERTREIGIRMAVGARQGDILTQFLIQTVVITFFGGIVGVIVAVVSLDIVGELLNLTPKLNVSMIVVALCVSVIIGLFFGIYPAVKASKLDPVKALRNE